MEGWSPGTTLYTATASILFTRIKILRVNVKDYATVEIHPNSGGFPLSS